MYTIKVIISQQADYVKIYIMMSQYLSECYKEKCPSNDISLEIISII